MNLKKDSRHDADSNNNNRDSANCTNTDSNHNACDNNDHDNYDHGTTNHKHADQSITVHINDNSNNNKSNSNESSNNNYNANDCGMTEHDANAHSKADSNSNDCAITDRDTDNCSNAECNNTNHDNFQFVTEITNPATHNNTMQKYALKTAIIQYERYVTTSHNNTPMNAAALDEEDDGTDQLFPSQRTLSTTVTPLLYSYADWDAFYKDHVQSLWDLHLDLLQKIMPVPDDTQLINNRDERPRHTDKATKTSLNMQALTFASATVDSGEQQLSNTITDSCTQTMRKNIGPT